MTKPNGFSAPFLDAADQERAEYAEYDRQRLHDLEVRDDEGPDGSVHGFERVAEDAADQRSRCRHEADDGEIPGDVRHAVLLGREREHHLVRAFPERGREHAGNHGDDRYDDEVIRRRQDEVAGPPESEQCSQYDDGLSSPAVHDRAPERRAQNPQELVNHLQNAEPGIRRSDMVRTDDVRRLEGADQVHRKLREADGDGVPDELGFSKGLEDRRRVEFRFLVRQRFRGHDLAHNIEESRDGAYGNEHAEHDERRAFRKHVEHGACEEKPDEVDDLDDGRALHEESAAHRLGEYIGDPSPPAGARCVREHP